LATTPPSASWAGGGKTVLLLDYETNCDVKDLSRPLSHASLVARFVGGA